MAHWAYKSSSSLLVFDRGVYVDTLVSDQGVKQGDCLATLLFSLSMMPFYVNCTKDIKEKVTKVAIADDLNLIGSPQAVFTAFENFSKSLADKHSGLSIRANKCGVLWPHAGEVPEEIRALAAKHGIPVHTGTMETLALW